MTDYKNAASTANKSALVLEQLVQTMQVMDEGMLSLVGREIERANEREKLALADAQSDRMFSVLAEEAEGPASEWSAPNTETFMNTEIKFKWGTVTPAYMLRYPAADIGLDMVADDWLDEISASDDPDFDMKLLIDNLTGVLTHLKLIRKHYRLYVEQAQQAAA